MKTLKTDGEDEDEMTIVPFIKGKKKEKEEEKRMDPGSNPGSYAEQRL